MIVTLPDEDWYPRPAIDVKGLTFGYAADRCDPREGSCDTVLRIFAMTAAGPALKREVPSHGDSVKIDSLGLARNGSEAWVECPRHGGDFDGNPRPNCVRPGLSVNRVYVLSSTGKDGSERLVAKGMSIDPASVNVSQGRARWTSAGRQHSVPVR